jgi:probable F420-dependent oxidoreductase
MPDPRPARFGITIPFDGISLTEHRWWFERLSELGYSDLWSAEVNGFDGFTPLALAAAWVPTARLGVAVTPAFTRGPAVLAQSVAALADAAPGRFTFGLGSSSEAIVSDWNGIAFDQPYRRVRDVLRFLRAALAGEKVSADYDTFSVKGFRLARPPADPPAILLGALRPQMLHLAAKEADGAILNFIGADDVPVAVAELDGPAEIAARIFVCPNPDAELARAVGRRMLASYLNVPAYAEFHRWLGRGELLEPMWEAWAAGDRKRSTELLPDEVVDALLVHGSMAECRQTVARYVANGVTVPVLMLAPVGVDLADAVAGLAPSAD